MALIISSEKLNDLNLDYEELGGKGVNLIRMKNAGLNVSEFLVLQNSFLNDLFKGTQKEIESLINAELVNKKGIPEISDQIQFLLMKSDLTTVLCDKIFTECDRLFGENFLVAVRSSAGSEDGNFHSFAGIHSSYLGVQKENLIEHIKNCLISAYSPIALGYRFDRDLSVTNIHFAIVIQKMVMAKRSGIGFSMDVQGNLANALIVAGYGLGEGVVSDTISTDSYLVDRANSKISILKYSQGEELGFDGDYNLELRSVINSSDTVLELDEVQLVFDQLIIAEKLLHSVSDVEFSFDENNQLFILQMRPETTLKWDELYILDNTNIVESYPGVSSPLTASFVKYAYKNVFTGALSRFKLHSSAQIKHVADDLIAYYAGRLLYRLDNWFKIIGFVFSSKRSMKSWENAVGLDVKNIPTGQLSFDKKVRVLFKLGKMLFTIRRGNKRFFEHFERDYTEMRTKCSKGIKNTDLYELFESKSQNIFQYWYLTLVNDILAFKSVAWMRAVLDKKNISDSEQLINDVLGSNTPSESQLAVIHLLKLKDLIVANDTYFKLFSLSSEVINDHYKNNDPAYIELFVLVTDYIDRFGDRGLAELKLESKTFRTDPITLFDVLKDHLESELSLRAFEDKKNERSLRAKLILSTHLHWYQPSYYKFKFAKSLASFTLKNREDMRYCRTRIYGASRAIFMQIADNLADNKIIGTREDIFYLKLPEIRSICYGEIPDNLGAEIEERKAKFNDHKSVSIPDRIIYSRNKPLPYSYFKSNHSVNTSEKLFGIPASGGIVEGEVLIVKSPDYRLDVKGKILITHITDPGWVFLMSQAKGIISEKGSILSHTAIVGREMGITVIVGVTGAQSILKNGDRIRMNGADGSIELV